MDLFRDTSTPAAPLVAVGENRNPRGCVNCGGPLRYLSDSFRQCRRCYESGRPIPGDPPAKRKRKKKPLTAIERERRRAESARKRARAAEKRRVAAKLERAAWAERMKITYVKVPKLPLSEKARRGLRIRLTLDVGEGKNPKNILYARVRPVGAPYALPVGFFVSALTDTWGSVRLLQDYPECVCEVEEILSDYYTRIFPEEIY